MIDLIKCPECDTKHVLNSEKHKFRPKYCMKCRAIIANEKPKHRVLSTFQKLKRLRKENTRERFMRKMQTMKYDPREIARRMVKVFDEEND